MRVVSLPAENAGIRKMIVDAQGKLWYVGSHNGHLGVIE
jgi:virginiamycin B lyase